MAGMMSETYMLQALQTGFASIKANPSQLSEILNALNTNELASAQSYFGNPKTQIYIAPGFPMEPSKMPFIGVTVAEDNQIPEQTPIGLVYERINNGDGTWTDIMGAPFRGTFKATIYTPNADLIVWLSAICSWALLTQYNWFINTAGLRNLQTGLGDYEPSSQWLPNLVFQRGVFLSGEFDKTFTGVPTIVTSSNTTGTFTDITTLNG